MIQREYRIKLTINGTVEHRIRRKRSGDMQPLAIRRRHCRHNFINFFAAQQAAFTAMGVKCSDRNMR